MDDDTPMDDRDRSQYPEPTALAQSPYPVLSRHASPSPSATPTQHDRPLLAPRPSEPSVSNTPASVSSYFSVSDAATPTPSLRPRSSESPAPWRDIRPRSNGQPWTTDFFNRLATPGGSNGSESNQQTRTNGTRSGNDYFNDPQSSLSNIRDDLLSPSGPRKRGRPRSRASSNGTSRGRGRGRGWKWMLKGTEHADIFAKPKTRSTVRKKRGRVAGKPRASVNASGDSWIDPGVEFRELQRNATRAYLEGDLVAALDFAKMAVLKNSEVFMAHKMIHDIYQQQGQEREAVVALFSGANTKRDPDLWAEVGDRILDFEERSKDDIEWARSCFSEAIRIKRDCYRARVGKLRLHEELKEDNQARMEAKTITEKWPEELEMVSKYAELCIKSGFSWEWERARDTYEKAFENYAGQEMLGDDADQQWYYLNDYLELLLRLGLYAKGIKQLKRLARWFLGRKEDTFWDDLSDDREFDSTNDRRIHLWQFQQGRISLDTEQYGDGLPLELRVKLGLFRLRMHAKDEAFRHFEHLLRDEVEVEGLEDVFLEVAECLSSHALFADALKFYERMMPLQKDDKEPFWLALAQCYSAVGRHAQAEACYLTIIKASGSQIEARIQLARLYDATGQREKAFKMAEEVTALSKREALAMLNKPGPQAPVKPLRKIAPKHVSNVVGMQPPRGSSTAASSSKNPAGLRFDAPHSSASARQEAARGANGQFGPQKTQTVRLGSVTIGHIPNMVDKETRERGSGDQASSQKEGLEERKTRVRNFYSWVKELWPSIHREGGEAEAEAKDWIRCASGMAAEFKNIHMSFLADEALYPGQAPKVNLLPQRLVQEMEKLKKRALGGGLWTEQDPWGMTPGSQGPIQGSLLDIPTSEWHHILCDLALLYAKKVQQEKCYDILENCLMKPVIFRPEPELVNTTQAVAMYCALLFNDSKLLTEVAQVYIFRSQKRSSGAFQLLAATGRLSHGEPYLYDRKTTRWMQEIVTAMDTSIKTARERRLAFATQRGPQPNGSPPDEETPDPGLLTVRAHSANHSDHHSDHHSARPALPFLLRALELQPDNLVINLSIATTYITNALRSTAAERADDIDRGLAFFFRYYDRRVAGGKIYHRQEAEYNLARLWHQLGLTHLAVPAYEKVLEMSADVKSALAEQSEEGEVRDDVGMEDFTMEAAFALQRVFLDAGNEEAAVKVAEEWLVL